MAKWHLNLKGDPGVCRAVQGQCPFGQHFEDQATARSAFESAASFESPERTKEEREFALDAFEDIIEVNNAVESSFYKLTIAGEDHPYLDVFRDQPQSVGNSQELADFMRTFTDDEERRQEGVPTYDVIDYTPVGSLLGRHHANSLKLSGETYVFDYGFAEVDPNAEWPYVGTVENWRKEIDKASVLGAPEKEPEPIDPRSLSIAVYPAGEANPLLDKAVMEAPNTNRNGTLTRYLSVDQVKVAAIHYAVENGNPHIHSLETREEYRQQGYMKKLLKELAAEHGIDRVYSSGSMTNDGYSFTSHLTKPREGETSKVNHEQFGEAGKGTFTFVTDWVNGWANS